MYIISWIISAFLFYSIFIYVVIVKATPIKQRKINPNEVKYYVSKEALKELESSIKIDTDLSKVTFFLWTPELGIDQPWEFKAGIDPQHLIDRRFDPKRPTKFISHGWTDNGNHAKPFAEGMKSFEKLFNFSSNLFFFVP